MTYGVTELVVPTKSRGWAHHGTPGSRCFDALLRSATHAAALASSASTRLTAARWREPARKHGRSGRTVVRAATRLAAASEARVPRG